MIKIVIEVEGETNKCSAEAQVCGSEIDILQAIELLQHTASNMVDKLLQSKGRVSSKKQIMIKDL